MSSILGRRRLFANKCSENREHIRISRKSWTNAIYSLPQAPFRKTNVQKIMKNMRISKTTWKYVIYSLPQAPFRQTNVQKIMKNMRISRKLWKIILKVCFIDTITIIITITNYNYNFRRNHGTTITPEIWEKAEMHT